MIAPIAVIFTLVILLSLSMVLLAQAKEEKQATEKVAICLRKKQEQLADRVIRFEAELHTVKVMNYTAR